MPQEMQWVENTDLSCTNNCVWSIIDQQNIISAASSTKQPNNLHGEAFKIVYKNPHCAACHGVQMNLTRCFYGSLQGDNYPWTRLYWLTYSMWLLYSNQQLLT